MNDRITNEKWQESLEEEAKTWNIPDLQTRREKLERERIRYPKLIKDLNLHHLDLEDKVAVELGSGPMSVLSIIPAKCKIAIDPLIDEYKKYHVLDPTIHWSCNAAEMIPGKPILPQHSADLVLIINALDHTRDPKSVVEFAEFILRPSGYLGIISCINNAINNPHPAHILNLDLTWLHQEVDRYFETCWERNYDGINDDYRYGWRLYKGKRGTPAFLWLGRKCTGYKENITNE